MTSKKKIEETGAAGVYKKASHEDEGMLVALPNGSGWSIHVDIDGNICVEGPLVLVG